MNFQVIKKKKIKLRERSINNGEVQTGVQKDGWRLKTQI